MGRPLRKDTIEEMEITVTTKDGLVRLGKQVGFNKYIVNEGAENQTVVKLADKLVDDNDAILHLDVNGEIQVVNKIVKNFVQTAEGVYAYKLTADGVKFADENVQFTNAKVDAEPKEDGTDIENEEETVAEQKVIEAEKVVEEKAEEPTQVKATKSTKK